MYKRQPYITADASGPKHVNQTLSRAKFELMIEPVLQKLKGPCENAVKDAKLAHHEIDEVVMVGGSTRIPKGLEMVKQIFGKEPNHSVNPCLLYTSPSPRDRTRSRMPSSA